MLIWLLRRHACHREGPVSTAYSEESMWLAGDGARVVPVALKFRVHQSHMSSALETLATTRHANREDLLMLLYH